MPEAVRRTPASSTPCVTRAIASARPSSVYISSFSRPFPAAAGVIAKAAVSAARPSAAASLDHIIVPPWFDAVAPPDGRSYSRRRDQAPVAGHQRSHCRGMSGKDAGWRHFADADWAAARDAFAAALEEQPGDPEAL